MGIINFDDINKSLNHEGAGEDNSRRDIFQEAMEDFLNKHVTSSPAYFKSLSKHLNIIFNTSLSPKYLVKEFIAKCDVISAELYLTLNTWVYDTAKKLSFDDDDEFNLDDLLDSLENEPENIANLLVDSFMKYNDIMMEAPQLAEKLKALPLAVKDIADANAKLYNDFNDARKCVYNVCAAIGVESDEFEKVLAKKIISKAKYPKSAGDKDAQQPTE